MFILPLCHLVNSLSHLRSLVSNVILVINSLGSSHLKSLASILKLSFSSVLITVLNSGINLLNSCLCGRTDSLVSLFIPAINKYSLLSRLNVSQSNTSKYYKQ